MKLRLMHLARPLVPSVVSLYSIVHFVFVFATFPGLTFALASPALEIEHCTVLYGAQLEV